MKFTIDKSIVSLLIIVTASFASLQGCGSNGKEPKSMDQIHNEEGIPVTVEILKHKPFGQYLSFFSRLRGIKEATKGAAIGGKIEKIYFKVGDYVKEKQVVLQFPEDHPGLQYEQAKAAYENSEKNYERMKALLEEGETSQAQFDAVETKYLVDKRNYEAAKQVLFIESPFDGTIVDIKVNEGDNIKKDAHLFTIAQLQKMKTKLWVTDKEIGQIKKGMTATTTYNGKTFYGKVSDVSIGMDPFKQAFAVEVEFNNPNRELKSGTTTEIKLLVYKNSEAIIVPRNLIRNDENGSYVFVAENSTAQKRYITNGRESGIYFEVSKGLNPGDKLITKGSAGLESGTKIKVVK